eukprot:scaffold1941_cov263-Pinguiococcus_pyrenoidosus.AAC.16
MVCCWLSYRLRFLWAAAQAQRPCRLRVSRFHDALYGASMRTFPCHRLRERYDRHARGPSVCADERVVRRPQLLQQRHRIFRSKRRVEHDGTPTCTIREDAIHTRRALSLWRQRPTAFVQHVDEVLQLLGSELHSADDWHRPDEEDVGAFGLWLELKVPVPQDVVERFHAGNP